MPLESGRGILGQLPVRDPAFRAGFPEPLVPEPTGGPAVSGVVDQKDPVAVGGDPGLIPGLFYRSDPVQDPFPGGPELDFLNEIEELDSFPIVSLVRCFLAHGLL